MPQPYKVLFDLHVCRNNYQAAAASMLTFARRLLREGAADASMLLEAERALGTAVSALSMVEPHEAWLEDPMPAGPAPTRAYLGDDAMEGKPNEMQLPFPCLRVLLCLGRR